MSFTPVIPTGGYGGWAFLKRTLATQQKTFESTTTLKREEDYFRAKIGSVKTAEALVSDKRLLRVALGAYGLSNDVNNTFFIRKILEDGTFNSESLANKLANKQYSKMSADFGFGDFPTPNTVLSDFPDKILARYRQQQFEEAVGNVSNDMRLALYTERELPAIAARNSSNDTKWFTIMGSPPLRSVFETAMGLPASFGSIDLDQQLTVFKERSAKLFGSGNVADFVKPEVQEKLIRQFLIRSDLASGNISGLTKGAGALALLQSRQSSASNILTLLR
ncbi:DUF1217 domain-containing protein [Gemmobacter denitrificans]|uniref:DUF1217 domain-containing protein n=1 Tax=Gemmobacter denitrificans TaxID=3123040 RepID=A0ABU8BVD0_9RHOB